jgi:hypothetical protein
VLLEVLDWLPQSAHPGASARLLPLCVVASRVFQGQAEGSRVKEISDHDAIVSSALQRIGATFRAGPLDVDCDKGLVCAAAADAACRALDNYSAPPACPCHRHCICIVAAEGQRRSSDGIPWSYVHYDCPALECTTQHLRNTCVSRLWASTLGCVGACKRSTGHTLQCSN